MGWHVPFYKLKFKYENAEWQQIDKHYDIFKDVDAAKNYCGNDAICLMDIYNWSVMKQTPITEDLYQLIVHRVGIIQTGFKENFWYGFDTDFFLNSLQFILGRFI